MGLLPYCWGGPALVLQTAQLRGRGRKLKGGVGERGGGGAGGAGGTGLNPVGLRSSPRQTASNQLGWVGGGSGAMRGRRLERGGGSRASDVGRGGRWHARFVRAPHWPRPQPPWPAGSTVLRAVGWSVRPGDGCGGLGEASGEPGGRGGGGSAAAATPLQPSPPRASARPSVIGNVVVCVWGGICGDSEPARGGGAGVDGQLMCEFEPGRGPARPPAGPAESLNA